MARSRDKQKAPINERGNYFMKETVHELVSAEKISCRVKEIAEQITRDYSGKELHLICILKGGVIFMVDLARQIGTEISVSFDFMDISSYGASTQSSGSVRIDKDLEQSIAGKDVVLVEDIIDSGRTLSHLMGHLKSKKPNSIRVCTLLDKPERRVVNDVVPEYVGFSIPDEFVVGYGLDYNQRYRNLSYIGVLKFDE